MAQKNAARRAGRRGGRAAFHELTNDERKDIINRMQLRYAKVPYSDEVVEHTVHNRRHKDYPLLVDGCMSWRTYRDIVYCTLLEMWKKESPAEAKLCVGINQRVRTLFSKHYAEQVDGRFLLPPKEARDDYGEPDSKAAQAARAQEDWIEAATKDDHDAVHAADTRKCLRFVRDMTADPDVKEEWEVVAAVHDQDERNDGFWESSLVKSHVHEVIRKRKLPGMTTHPSFKVIDALDALGINMRVHEGDVAHVMVEPDDDDDNEGDEGGEGTGAPEDAKRKGRVPAVLPLPDMEVWVRGGMEKCGNYRDCAVYVSHQSRQCKQDGKHAYGWLDEEGPVDQRVFMSIPKRTYTSWVAGADTDSRISKSQLDALLNDVYEAGRELRPFDEWKAALDPESFASPRMRACKEKWQKGVDDRVKEMAKEPVNRFCVYVKGPQGIGKTYAMDRALAALGVDPDQVYQVPANGTGKTDDLTPRHEAMKLDDNVIGAALAISDDHYGKVGRRNEGNPWWLGHYVVATGNIDFDAWGARCMGALNEKYLRVDFSYLRHARNLVGRRRLCDWDTGPDVPACLTNFSMGLDGTVLGPMDEDWVRYKALQAAHRDRYNILHVTRGPSGGPVLVLDHRSTRGSAAFVEENEGRLKVFMEAFEASLREHWVDQMRASDPSFEDTFLESDHQAVEHASGAPRFDPATAPHLASDACRLALAALVELHDDLAALDAASLGAVSLHDDYLHAVVGPLLYGAARLEGAVDARGNPDTLLGPFGADLCDTMMRCAPAAHVLPDGRLERRAPLPTRCPTDWLDDPHLMELVSMVRPGIRAATERVREEAARAKAEADARAAAEAEAWSAQLKAMVETSNASQVPPEQLASDLRRDFGLTLTVDGKLVEAPEDEVIEAPPNDGGQDHEDKALPPAIPPVALPPAGDVATGS